MALKNLFDMAKADKYTADGREALIKAQEAETEDKVYQIGEISQKTGLQKTANGWVKPKNGKQPGAKKQNAPTGSKKIDYQVTEKGGKFYATGHQFSDGSQLHAGPFGSEKELHEFMNGSPYKSTAESKPGAKKEEPKNVHGAEVDKIYERQLKRIKELKAKGFTDEQIDNDKIIKQTKEDMKNVGKTSRANKEEAIRKDLGLTAGEDMSRFSDEQIEKMYAKTQQTPEQQKADFDKSKIGQAVNKGRQEFAAEKARQKELASKTNAIGLPKESKPAAQEVKLGGGADTYYFEDPDNMSNEDKVFKSLGIELAETFGDHDGDPGNTETWANGWLDNIMDNGGLGIKSKKTRQPAAPVPAEEVMRIVEENPARWNRIIGNAKKFYEGKGNSTDFESDEHYPIKLVGGKTKPSAQYYAEGKRNKKNNPLTGSDAAPSLSEIVDRVYNIGEISEKTGLQKTAQGWRPVKKGAAGTKQPDESARIAASKEARAKKSQELGQKAAGDFAKYKDLPPVQRKDALGAASHEGISIGTTQRSMEGMGWDLIQADDKVNVYGKPDGSKAIMKHDGKKITEVSYEAPGSKPAESKPDAADQRDQIGGEIKGNLEAAKYYFDKAQSFSLTDPSFKTYMAKAKEYNDKAKAQADDNGFDWEEMHNRGITHAVDEFARQNKSKATDAYSWIKREAGDSAPRQLTGDCRIRIRKEKPALTGDTKIRVRK